MTKEQAIVRIVSNKKRPEPNFILRPKYQVSEHVVPDAVNLYQTISNEFASESRPGNKASGTEASKQVMLKNRRKGLEEVFPSLHIEQDNRSLQPGIEIRKYEIKRSYNWCAASGLGESDLVGVTAGKERLERSRAQKIFSHVFNEQLNILYWVYLASRTVLYLIHMLYNKKLFGKNSFFKFGESFLLVFD